MARIESFGAYVPMLRLSRNKMAEAWGIPGVPGERSVANIDEDSITMAVAAGSDCLAGVDPATVDAVYFATTTAPYDEKQGAGVIAAALDLRRDINTADFSGSLRAASSALRAAMDAVDSGSVKKVLVVAADCRLAEPESVMEQLLGDGAGAILVSTTGPALVRGFHSVTGEQIGQWRRNKDAYVRSFEAKAESQFGYLPSAIKAGKELLSALKIEPSSISRSVITAGDPLSGGKVAVKIGVNPAQLEDVLFFTVGNPGVPLVLMMLANALANATAGNRLLVVNNGDGADAFVIDIEQPFPAVVGRRGLAGSIAIRRELGNYTDYVRFRSLLRKEEVDPRGSAVTYWRDSAAALNLHAAKCRVCGDVNYPRGRICGKCHARDQFDEITLARRGEAFTYTLDHIDAGQYVNQPVPRVVVDVENGGRLFLSMTDGGAQDIRIGLPLELVFRRLHQASGFFNYYWKCRAIPGAADAKR